MRRWQFVGFVWLSFLVCFSATESFAGVLDSLQCDYPEDIFQKVDDPLQATRLYYRALEEMRTYTPENARLLKRLEADVDDILSERDRERYRSLLTHPEKVQFFLYFWRREDVTAATEVNERLVEHYRRLAYARRAFSAINPRGYDDRGSIYVKYGEPDERIINPNLAFSDPIETWAYYRFGNPITFDFIDRGEGYRLALRFDEGVKPADEYSRWVAIGELLALRSHLSPAWFAMRSQWEALSNEEVSQRRKLFLMNQIINEQTEKIVSEQKQLPITTTDLLADQKKLPFTAQIAWFRNGIAQHEFAVLLGIRRRDLQLTSADSATTLIASVGVKFPDHRLFNSVCDTIHVLRSDAAPEDITRVWQFQLGPGNYLFALDVQNSAGRQREIRSFISSTGPHNNGQLQISSLVFATDVQPAGSDRRNGRALRRHGLQIFPYPFNEVSRRQPVFLYFELYNLQMDSDGEANYAIDYIVERQGRGGLAGALSRFNPFGGSKDRISLSETRRSQGPQTPVYLQLDFRNLISGDYRLQVKVKDRIAGVERQRSLAFRLTD